MKPDTEPQAGTNKAGPAEPSRLLRVVLVIVGLVAWFGTQTLIGQMGFPEGGIGDGLFTLLTPLHAYLVENPRAADALLITSSAVIDLFAIFVLAASIFGPSIRPFLGLLLLFFLRQICQALVALPAPEGMIWRYPGLPSLLVTYYVANDFFFSGHTAIGVYGAIEMARTGKRWLTVVGVAGAVYAAFSVLVLRAHYTMDVFTAVIAALLAGVVAARLAPRVDQALSR